jgi:hypothetical protein
LRKSKDISYRLRKKSSRIPWTAAIQLEGFAFIEKASKKRPVIIRKTWLMLRKGKEWVRAYPLMSKFLHAKKEKS